MTNIMSLYTHETKQRVAVYVPILSGVLNFWNSFIPCHVSIIQMPPRLFFLATTDAYFIMDQRTKSDLQTRKFEIQGLKKQLL